MSTPDLPGPDLSGARRLQARKHSAVGLPVAGLLVLGVIGLVMVGVATSRVGVLPALVGALAALIPVGAVFAAIVWIDRWEPEPPVLMLGAFLWGAGGATACALLLNDSVVGLGELLFGPSRRVFFERALMAPLVEEAAKALFVVALWFRRRSEFNGLVDGIVYAGLTAAGFAFTENILYFGKAFAEGGLGSAAGGVVAVFILRGILAPFSHPLFTSMVGIGIGLAARTADNRRRVLWPVLGYLAAVVLHAAWNASTLLGGTGFLNVYFLIMVPIFAGTGWLVVWQRKREQKIVVDQLPVLQRAGLIARSEVELLASLAGRRGWQRKVRRSAGAEAAKAVRDYQIAVTELAFLQHRAAEGRTTSAVRRARREQLIQELKEARRSAVGSREAFRTARVKLDELTQSVRRPGRVAAAPGTPWGALPKEPDAAPGAGSQHPRPAEPGAAGDAGPQRPRSAGAGGAPEARPQSPRSAESSAARKPGSHRPGPAGTGAAGDAEPQRPRSPESGRNPARQAGPAPDPGQQSERAPQPRPGSAPPSRPAPESRPPSDSRPAPGSRQAPGLRRSGDLRAPGHGSRPDQRPVPPPGRVPGEHHGPGTRSDQQPQGARADQQPQGPRADQQDQHPPARSDQQHHGPGAHPDQQPPR